MPKEREQVLYCRVRGHVIVRSKSQHNIDARRAQNRVSGHGGRPSKKRRQRRFRCSKTIMQLYRALRWHAGHRHDCVRNRTDQTTSPEAAENPAIDRRSVVVAKSPAPCRPIPAKSQARFFIERGGALRTLDLITTTHVRANRSLLTYIQQVLLQWSSSSTLAVRACRVRSPETSKSKSHNEKDDTLMRADLNHVRRRCWHQAVTWRRRASAFGRAERRGAL